MEYAGIVDGYRIRQETKEEAEEREKELGKGIRTNVRYTIITYMRGGEFFAESKYENLSFDSLRKIREQLFEYAVYNLNDAETVSQAVPLITMISAVEAIIRENP